MRALLALSLLLAAGPARASDPISLFHSGFLLGPTDTPVTDPALAATFRLVDRAGSGEAELWSTSCNVEVRAGYFAVELGRAPCAGTSPLLPETLGTGDVFLEIVFGTTTLVPRLRLADPPRAVWARSAAALDPSALAGLVQKSELGTLPLDPGGTADATTFLRGDGTWAVPAAPTVSVSPTGGLTGDGRSTPLAIATGAVTNALLASDAASLTQVSAGALGTTSGRVGVGRTPTTAKLEVAGGVKLGNETGTCSSSAEYGTLRWNGVAFQGCTPTGWIVLQSVTAATVSTVSPTTGPTRGNVTITINGSGFASPLSVTVGGVAATNVVFQSASSVLATLPASTAGAKDVTVLMGDGRSATLTGGITLVASGEDSTNAATSCLSIRNAGGSVGTGNGYWLNPSGSGAFRVYCDMVTDGGGWTLVAAFGAMANYDMYTYTAAGRLPSELYTSFATLRPAGSAAGQGPTHLSSSVINALFAAGQRQYLTLTGTGSGGYVLARHTKTAADAGFDAYKGIYWTSYTASNGFVAHTVSNTGFNANPLPIASPSWGSVGVPGRACAAPPGGVGCYHYLPDDIAPVGTGEWAFRENNDNTPADSYAGSSAVPNLVFIR